MKSATSAINTLANTKSSSYNVNTHQTSENCTSCPEQEQSKGAWLALLKFSPRFAYSALLFVNIPMPT
jgi:hypothetical protein